MFVLLILAIRFFSHQSKQESKTIIIDDEAMNSNSKMEKNSHSFTNLSNYQKPALLADDDLSGLEKIENRDDWYVTANSWQSDNDAHDEGPPKYIKDNDRNTKWHTRYNDNGNGTKTPPFYFLVDLNKTVLLGGFQYGPRQSGTNGRFTDYNFYTGTSIDEVEKKIKAKDFTKSGDFIYNVGETGYKSVRLNKEVKCSVVALETNGTEQGKPGSRIRAAVCSEFFVYVNPYIETESPTESETESPTESETESPTESETESPTESETESPTESETESPTESETESPTESETESPTESETESPTESETESPTEIKTESPTESETESPTEIKTESPTEIKTESPTESETKSKTDSETERESERESETETGSENEKETETQAEKESETIIENETEKETETKTNKKSEFETEIENSSSEAEETNINSEKVTQTESDKEEQESTQSSDEKDDDQSQTDVQYPTSLETKVVTSTITEEIIPPDEGTNSPSQVIITTTKETTSHTSQNTTDVIDNTETEIERESNIESNIDSEDSKDKNNTALIAGVTVGAIVLIIIIVLLIIFLIYRHKHLEYNSADNDFSVEMDDGALNILETNIDTQDAYIHSNQSDIAENPFMKDDFIESNNASDINDNSDSNNVDDSQVSESNSE